MGHSVLRRPSFRLAPALASRGLRSPWVREEASAGAVTGAIQSQIADSLVAPGIGLALLAAYAALAVLAGSWLINRHNID